MSKIKKHIFYTTILIGILVWLYTPDVGVYKVERISNSAAEKSILNHYLDRGAGQLLSSNDTSYVLFKINIKNTEITKPLMVLAGQDFYVFQDKQLIYFQENGSYYQGVEKNKNQYLNIEYNPKLSQFQELHYLPIRSEKPLYVLMHRADGTQSESYITNPKVIIKNIQRFKKFNFPVIKINTHNKPINNKEYSFSSSSIITPDLQQQFLTKIKIRGNTSLDFPKKQFNLFFEEEGVIGKQVLKKNILVSSYSDKSLIRNKISQDLFSLLKTQTPTSSYSHIIINDVYEGVYLLFEHPIEKFKKRLKKDTTFNFLLKIDRGPHDFIGGDIDSLYIKAGYNLECPSIVNLEEKRKIKMQIEKLETGLINQDFSIINIESFVDFIILNELSKNIDAYRLNTYLSYINSRFSIDFVWDFDLSWGLPYYNDGYNYENFIIESDIKTALPYWWQSIWSSDLFQQKIRTRYQELRQSILSSEQIEKKINDLYEENKADFMENFVRWKIINEKIWPNKFNFQSYNEEVQYLKSWAKKRLDWLDLQWGVIDQQKTH